MAPVRTLLHAHSAWLALLLALALAIKAIVPAGTMLAAQDKRITVVLCADGIGEHRTVDLVLPMEQPPAGKAPGKMDGSCSFGALGMAGLAGADGIQLAAALKYIIVRGYSADAPVMLEQVRQLRPPPRGPPFSV